MAMWKVRIPCRSTTTLPHTSWYHSLRTGVSSTGRLLSKGGELIDWVETNRGTRNCLAASSCRQSIQSFVGLNMENGNMEHVSSCFFGEDGNMKSKKHAISPGSRKTMWLFLLECFFVQTIVWVRVYKQQLQGTTLLYSFHSRLGLPGISTSPWWVSTNPWLPKSITAPTSHGHHPLAVKNAICAVFNGKAILMCCWKWWQLKRSKTCREGMLVHLPNLLC